jgi:hypothetical protein
MHTLRTDEGPVSGARCIIRTGSDTGFRQCREMQVKAGIVPTALVATDNIGPC